MIMIPTHPIMVEVGGVYKPSVGIDFLQMK